MAGYLLLTLCGLASSDQVGRVLVMARRPFRLEDFRVGKALGVFPISDGGCCQEILDALVTEYDTSGLNISHVAQGEWTKSYGYWRALTLICAIVVSITWATLIVKDTIVCPSMHQVSNTSLAFKLAGRLFDGTHLDTSAHSFGLTMQPLSRIRTLISIGVGTQEGKGVGTYLGKLDAIVVGIPARNVWNRVTPT